MRKKTNGFVFWAPRILGIAFACFLALFSLDVFGNGLGFWGTLLALLIHNIPSFVLVAVVVIAWRRELVGAVALVAAGLLYIVLLLMSRKLEWYMLSWSAIIAGPTFLTGILFFADWRRKRKSGSGRRS